MTKNRTLVQWTVLQAINSGKFDRLVVSTDCEDIWNDVCDLCDNADLIRGEASFILNQVTVERHVRKPEHATDQASSMDVIRDYVIASGHTVEKLVLLQPTNPFRFARTLQHVLDACDEKNPYVFTAKTVPHTYQRSIERESELCLPVRPSIDCAANFDEYVPNGSIYCWRVFHYLQGSGSEVPICQSINPAVILSENALENVDIDTVEQANMAAAYLSEYHEPEGMITGHMING